MPLIAERTSPMFASSYPLLDLVLTMLWFVIFVFWIMLVFQIIVDVFRSHDLSGGLKALWMIFIIFLPFLGVFVYLIARGGKMHERQAQAAIAQQKAMEDYIRSVANKPQS